MHLITSRMKCYDMAVKVVYAFQSIEMVIKGRIKNHYDAVGKFSLERQFRRSNVITSFLCNFESLMPSRTRCYGKQVIKV